MQHVWDQKMVNVVQLLAWGVIRIYAFRSKPHFSYDFNRYSLMDKYNPCVFHFLEHRKQEVPDRKIAWWPLSRVKCPIQKLKWSDVVSRLLKIKKLCLSFSLCINIHFMLWYDLKTEFHNARTKQSPLIQLFCNYSECTGWTGNINVHHTPSEWDYLSLCAIHSFFHLHPHTRMLLSLAAALNINPLVYVSVYGTRNCLKPTYFHIHCSWVEI